MFESEIKLRAFLQNVTSSLEPGGVFIGTTIDSDRLVHKIRQSPTLTIENDFYKIVFGQDTFTSTFGLKYYFFLEDAIGERSATDR
jgi:mRNA (guanine-N7-)-methyltransferase